MATELPRLLQFVTSNNTAPGTGAGIYAELTRGIEPLTC